MEKRKYKPWTECARLADRILAMLHAATPFLIEECESVSDWVRNLKFFDLSMCDSICRGLNLDSLKHPGGFLGTLMEATETPEDEKYRQKLCSQFAMRLFFVCDIARRMPPSVRKSIPWTGDLEKDMSYLLIDYWRMDALYWAHNYGSFHF